MAISSYCGVLKKGHLMTKKKAPCIERLGGFRKERESG
jgi:hypothetical protein